MDERRVARRIEVLIKHGSHYATPKKGHMAMAKDESAKEKPTKRGGAKLPPKFRESCERKGVSPNECRRMAKIINAMYDESPRARALIAIEWLSDALERLLRAKFKATSTVAPKPDFFLRGHAPFASVFMRIEVCAAFGLITHEKAREMHAVRDIRNHCAHSTAVATPEDNEMADLVHILRGVHPSLVSESASMVVVLATAHLVGTVYATRQLLIQRPHRKHRTKPSDTPPIEPQ